MTHHGSQTFSTAAVEAARGHGESEIIYSTDLYPRCNHKGNIMPCICQFRTRSRLCRASTSDTSLMCLQRKKLWVRLVFDVIECVQYSLRNAVLPKRCVTLLVFILFLDILVKAQEGKKQRGEHTNYCLFRNQPEPFQPP